MTHDHCAHLIVCSPSSAQPLSHKQLRKGLASTVKEDTKARFSLDLRKGASKDGVNLSNRKNSLDDGTSANSHGGCNGDDGTTRLTYIRIVFHKQRTLLHACAVEVPVSKSGSIKARTGLDANGLLASQCQKFLVDLVTDSRRHDVDVWRIAVLSVAVAAAQRFGLGVALIFLAEVQNLSRGNLTIGSTLSIKGSSLGVPTDKGRRERD